MVDRDSPVPRTPHSGPDSVREPEPPAPENALLIQEGTGDPDGFKRLWTPHRMAYIRGENKPGEQAAGEACPFCRVPGLPDEDGLMVARGRTVFTVLNLYPYNSGHLMVCPYRHAADNTEHD